jgi:lysophospholipase L1-like esterase
MFNIFKNTRRDFIRTAAIGTASSLLIPEIVSAAFTSAKPKKIQLQKGNVILFQGDSITDWGRSKTVTTVNNSQALGNGYSFLTAANLMEDYAEKSLQIYNRGISGNKVFQLADRWDDDCLKLKPNVLSILVGVNDFWHTLTNGYTGTIEKYTTDYKTLLDRTKQALPDVSLIIGEPFGVKDVKSVNNSWYPKFNEYRLAAREIADTYHATFIPYQSVFDEAIKRAPGSYWTTDGVHPSVAGGQLMAKAWMETVKG